MHDHDDHDHDLTRRSFLLHASAGLSALMAGTFGLPGIAIGANGSTKTLIKIFQRGGCDGLNMFPKYGDPKYNEIRPNIQLRQPSGTDSGSIIALDRMWGMNPNLLPLMEIWDDNKMAVSVGTHFAKGNRSHFDCQRWIEYGVEDDKAQGLFNRYLQNVAGDNPLRAVRAGNGNAADIFYGDIAVPSIGSSAEAQLVNYDLCAGNGCADNQLTTKLRELGSNTAGLSKAPTAEKRTREVERIMVEVMDTVKNAAAGYVPNAGGLNYSTSPMGKGLRLIAQLLKAGIPVEVAAIDWSSGWDTHENQLRLDLDPTDQTKYDWRRGMRSGADDLLCFYRDMGTRMNDVAIVVGTEFGREAIENGTFGTDHGIGGAWLAIGGRINGGLYGTYDSLDPAVLQDGRFVPNTISYKDILAEAMAVHLEMPTSLVSTMFPGHAFTNHSMFSATV
jgi:uncharacterized protein (DUF1501 family)